MNNKPRVIKDFEKLDENLQQQIKLSYPSGFSDHLIRFTDKDGKYVSALPFETDEKYYLVRMSEERAEEIITDDEDFDDDGNLKAEVKEEYEDKYADLDYISIKGEKEEEEEDEEIISKDQDDDDDDEDYD